MILFRLIFIFILFLSTLFSAEISKNASNTSLIKQKIEIRELKKQLNEFYNKKEKEYQTRKTELKTILNKIEKEKKAIQELHDANQQILNDVQSTVVSKTAKIYNKMKPKIAASIFDEMIKEGKIEDVFDIIVKLKEKTVTDLMKFLDPKNAAMLTIMLKNYKVKNQNEG
jgi:flagellar motility protein MotE (MotC chaperone)